MEEDPRWKTTFDGRLHFQVVFIFEVFSIFKVVFIFQVVYLFEVVYLFQFVFLVYVILIFQVTFILARADGIAVGHHQAVDWQQRQWTAIFTVIFLSPFSVATFSNRRSARIKKLIQRKLTTAPKNLGLDPFSDPVGHFGAPWWPFWVLQAVRRCRR